MYTAIVKKKKLYEEVVDQIIDLVRKKRLRPGDKLPPERELADELGVSRTVFREAIKALEEKDLVEVRHGSGTYVRNPSVDIIAKSFPLIVWMEPRRYFQLMDLREYLDVEIAGRLAHSVTEEDLFCMSQAIERMWQLLDSPREFTEQDVAFHLAFYKATKNELLLSIMNSITRLLMEAIELTITTPGAAEMSLRRHEALLECIRAGDAEGARRNMQEIIARGKLRLHQALDI